MVSESVLPVRFRQYKEGEVSKNPDSDKSPEISESDTTNRERCPQNIFYSDTTNKDICPQKQLVSTKTTLIQTLQIRTGVYKNNSDSDTTNKDMSPEKQP